MTAAIIPLRAPALDESMAPVPHWALMELLQLASDYVALFPPLGTARQVRISAALAVAQQAVDSTLLCAEIGADYGSNT